jgi:hypothetical protein
MRSKKIYKKTNKKNYDAPFLTDLILKIKIIYKKTKSTRMVLFHDKLVKEII